MQLPRGFEVVSHAGVEVVSQGAATGFHETALTITHGSSFNTAASGSLPILQELQEL